MKKIIAGAIAISILLSSLLTGCASSTSEVEESTLDTQLVVETGAKTEVTETTEATTEPSTESPTEPPVETEPQDSLTEEQLNSINMLNYLTALVTEINASSSSRVYLESVYDEIRSNTDPSVVDAVTLIEYEAILDLLFEYRMIAVQRERLQYIYDQNSAVALRAALPSPLSLMNVVQSRGGLKTIVSVLFMAMDSANSYTAYTNEAEMQYLQDSWALDDDEATSLHNSRKSMFSYMVRIVNDYGLPESFVLNEASVTRFVEWKNHSNLAQRILFLESNEETYSAFGDYWLVLAESYYLDNQYNKCLESVEQYLTLNNGIFRKDYKFAEVIPYAIVSAKATMGSEEYSVYADEYIGMLLANTDQDDWAMRYFAAQTYVEQYGLTGEEAYLRLAYNTTLQTLNYLVEEQKHLNTEYLADIVEIETPEDATSEEKKTIREYNKYLKNERKIALPPVYEPLRLNCDLLFALATNMNLSWSEKKNVDDILHDQGNALFLDANLDSMYWMSKTSGVGSIGNIEVVFNGDSFTIPAQYVSSISQITLTVNGHTVTDWVIREVDRNKSAEIGAFAATYTSEAAEDIEYSDGDEILIEIRAYDDNDAATLSFSFIVEKTYVLKVAVSTKFTRV